MCTMGIVPLKTALPPRPGAVVYTCKVFPVHRTVLFSHTMPSQAAMTDVSQCKLVEIETGMVS